VASRIYVGYIDADPAVIAKIQGRAGGGCTLAEVRAAFQNRLDVNLRRRPGTEPPEVAGFGETGEGRRLFAALVAVDEGDGAWRLKSAWPVDDSR
jgi:hypothetical protein